MNLMTSEYNVERAKLEASKAEVMSEIEGAKNRIDVGISEGELGQVKTTISSHKVAQQADLERLDQKKDKTVRDTDRAKGYLSKMVIRAPIDGIVNILPNFRSSGSFGSAPPPFKEGDRAWTGAAIAEIPDLTRDADRTEAGGSGSRQAATRAERQDSRGCNPGQGIPCRPGLDQSDRVADVPWDGHDGEDVPGPRHAEESGSAACGRA